MCPKNGYQRNHVAFPIYQEEFVPGLETDWPVSQFKDKVEVQIVQLQVSEHLLAGSLHQAFLMYKEHSLLMMKRSSRFTACSLSFSWLASSPLFLFWYM